MPTHRAAVLPLCALLLAAGLSADAATARHSVDCDALHRERALRVRESAGLSSSVETTNVELGETADALRAATDPGRRRELARRAAALRRELSTLLDRERESVDRLGTLDTEIAARCRARGGR